MESVSTEPLNISYRSEDMSVRDCLDYLNWCRSVHPALGSAISWAHGPESDLYKKVRQKES